MSSIGKVAVVLAVVAQLESCLISAASYERSVQVRGSGFVTEGEILALPVAMSPNYASSFALSTSPKSEYFRSLDVDPIFFNALTQNLAAVLGGDSMEVWRHNCADDQVVPFDKALVAAMQAGLRSQVFFFPVDSALGPFRSIDSTAVIPGPGIPGPSMEKLRDFLLSPATYKNDRNIQKSCPFIPSLGFKFSGGIEETWWLMSEYCETAMLVRGNDNWWRASPLTLNFDALRTLDQIKQGRDLKKLFK